MGQINTSDSDSDSELAIVRSCVPASVCVCACVRGWVRPCVHACVRYVFFFTCSSHVVMECDGIHVLSLGALGKVDKLQWDIYYMIYLFGTTHRPAT